MAGIGFELKRLFAGKGLLQGMRACFFSVIITIGPTLLCIFMLTILQRLLFYWRVADSERELFMASVIYSFLFSLVITSGFTMILSRYISDKVYKKEYQDILPSLKGAITICTILGGITGGVFLYRSPLGLSFKVPAYMLFMELNILWLQTVYISALRDYRKLVRGFFTGVTSSFLLAFILVRLLKVHALTGVLIAVDAGFFVIVLSFQDCIQRFFNIESRRYFTFLEYLDQYPELFFTGMLYTLGLYMHNFYFWNSRCGVIIGGTYAFAPVYDVPTFWAFLTVLPTMVIFVVSCETTFYEKYKAYYDMICNGGHIDDIFRLRDEMGDIMSRNLRNIMGIQLTFTILCLSAGMLFLPLTGLPELYIEIFNVLVIGDYAFIIMFICLTVLLYFDDRKGALWVVSFFTLANAYLTGATIFLGEHYYGLGFMLAAFLALLISFTRLNNVFKNIHYFTFCSQPIVSRRKEHLFTWLSRRLQSILDKGQSADRQSN